MKDESKAFIDQAGVMLMRANRMLAAGLNEDAAREAYLACFHIAQAYIFERTGQAAKSHHGVQTEFFRLTRHDARTDPELRRFLSQSYEFKSIADYGTGPDAVVPPGVAAAAMRQPGCSSLISGRWSPRLTLAAPTAGQSDL